MTARLRPPLADLLVALGFTAAAWSSISSGDASRTWLYFLALVGTLPLAVRRAWPLPVLVIVATITGFAAAEYGGWWPFAALLAFYSVGANAAPRRRSILACAAGLAWLAIPVASQIDWAPLGWNDVALVAGRLAPLAGAWLLGDSLRSRRAYVQAVEDRAAQLEREQAANTRRAAAEEQSRIAREVHDVVAHNLSVIIVQATAAERVFDLDPADARRAVGTIGATARSALDELRRVLAVVRPDGQSADAYSPQPDLDRLDALFEQVRAAGLDVELEIVGEPRKLPSALELSAYRIVQEALTNTLRHAQASRAVVALRYAEDALEVEIVDDGTAAANGNGDGHGLIGMRERAATFGGGVETGHLATGGFRVAAVLPLGTAAR